MRIVSGQSAIRARVVPPSDHGYLLLAAEVDWRGPFRPPGPAKRKLLADVRSRRVSLVARPGVLEATVFRAVLIAPGEGTELLEARSGKVRRARWDVVVLIRTISIDAARRLRSDRVYTALADVMRKAARRTMEVVASNVVRLGDVDHRPDHVFLFNYFYGDDPKDLVPVFEYTAGWFQAKTRLANSTLLQPLDGEATDNAVINHASWPDFRSFLPSLLFRPTFRKFVLANFAANNIAAQPILYRRV